jgi:GMP synthase-like glutamine amidotransferase
MKPVLIIQNAEIVTPGTITEYLKQNNIAYDIVHTYQKQTLPDLDDVEHVINLGSDQSVRDYFRYDHLKRVSHFVKELIRLDKKYLGICFSGQMLAHILDADVEKNRKIEIGVHDITLTEAGINDAVFKNIRPNFKTFQWHSDCFKIPDGCSNLAESDITTNQAFHYKNAVGLQFHPEADITIAKTWVDALPNDVEKSGQSADKILNDFESSADEIKTVNFQLLDNFLN